MANLKSRQVGSIHILTPKGYLTGGEETEELEKAIRQLGEDGNKNLIINLGETQHLNSTALVVLISAHSIYVRPGGQMQPCAVDKRLENSLAITTPSVVFDVKPTEEQAIASYAGGDSA